MLYPLYYKYFFLFFSLFFLNSVDFNVPDGNFLP